MNSYITLDSKYYLCPHGNWVPSVRKPMTVRRNVDGTVDVTYGSGTFKEWRGDIECYPTSPPSGYGTLSDLRTTILKTQSVSFTDHYGTAYTVHIVSPFDEKSLGPKWDAASNKMYVTVVLVAE